VSHPYRPHELGVKRKAAGGNANWAPENVGRRKCKERKKLSGGKRGKKQKKIVLIKLERPASDDVRRKGSLSSTQKGSTEGETRWKVGVGGKREKGAIIVVEDQHSGGWEQDAKKKRLGMRRTTKKKRGAQ